MSKTTVGSKSEKRLKSVPDMEKPFDDSIMNDISDVLQPVGKLNGNVSKELLKPFCPPANLNISVNFDKYERLTSFMHSKMIPKNQPPHTYLVKAGFLFLDSKVCIFSAIATFMTQTTLVHLPLYKSW